MTDDPESTLPVPATSQPPRSRWRRYAVLAACVAFIAIAAPIAFYLWASSAATQELVRRRIIATLEETTGGRVQIASFHWNVLNLEADASGVVIHGLEAPSEAPLALADHLKVSITVLGFFSPHILLRNLEIDHPAFHVIVYPGGSTNLPTPHRPNKPRQPALETLFNLQAGHVSIQQGELHFESRAAQFDFQNRYIPLDCDARNVAVLMSYIPPAGSAPETYRLDTSASDLSVQRGTEKPALGSMQATLDLTRTAAYLRSLKLTTSFPAVKGRATDNHTVQVSGVLEDFAHPRWQAEIAGEIDMRLLSPALGYPFAPQGIAQLNLDTAGAAGDFRIDGAVHIDDGSYIGTGVVTAGLTVDARVHADPRQLLLNHVLIHLRQGGQMDGEVDLSPWLSSTPAPATIERSAGSTVRASGSVPWHRPPPPDPNLITIPVNGKVVANFHDVSLDAVMDMVGPAPFQRLGFDTRLNGSTLTNWVKGDQNTVAVTANFALTEPAHPVSGEIPAHGSVDAIYTQSNGAVDLHKLEVQTGSSDIQAQGRLGAYPLTSPSGLTVDFRSSNLADFDAVLRDLGLNREGASGAAALPVKLAGLGEFHGAWTGSLLSPHITGTAKATNLAIEMLPAPAINAARSKSGPASQFVRWDAVEATGSYTDEQIAISHGLLQRGPAEIDLDGTLNASLLPIHPAATAFDANSQLHAHIKAAKVGLDDLMPFTGRTLPVTGTLDAQLQLDGPVHTLDGSGWAELDGATVYGEPITRLRAQGAMNNQVLKLTSVTAAAPAGTLTAVGTYDLNSHHFLGNAKSSGIDIAKIDHMHRQDPDAAGSLTLTVIGSGTLDDPRIEAHAGFGDLSLGGQPLGDLVFVAHTANHAATYTATTRLQGAELSLTGQTALTGDYATQAKLEFSQFDIGGLLKTAHVQGLTGESALAGTVTVEGPLAHPLDLHGEARLEQLAATIAGVHLASQGGVHATLASGRVLLDPVHITGEDTNLNAQGSINFRDKQQLDFAASGSINLKLAETVDPDLTASGLTTFQVEAHGPLKNPGLQGSVDFQNGSLSLEDVPNGLSQLHGTLAFNQNRLEVKSLTAMSGGGLLSVGGYLAYQHGLYADLSVTGKGVRIRYPEGVSSLADTTLRLQGSQNNLLLSGDVLITRFSISPDFDFAALATQANAVTAIAPPDAPSNHIRLDVHLSSSPQLNFQNAYAKLAGNVDLRLHGTVASPSLLGRVSITEGSAIVAGTRYDLQRGDIFFNNPVRIEPSIDLNATARVEDYDITLGLHGTPQKLSVTYRSDPPLPEADVVALLALGRTESQQRLFTQQQEQSVANPTTDALLGGALNATVSSRVQKLFGAGSVKVDPNYIGTLGNSTSRITVEEQLGRNVTLTYATNVDTTGQQLLQAEIAINRHVSLLVARDESGVFSMVVKATRRYR